MTFTERCKLATDCLPDAPYRAMLEALHREMLAALQSAGQRGHQAEELNHEPDN